MEFIKKNFVLAPNSTYKPEDYRELLTESVKYNTYIETAKSENGIDSDTLHYRIHKTAIDNMCSSFLESVKTMMRQFRNKYAILVIDYTYEPFYGSTETEYIHGYKPKNGCKGCYKFLVASVIIDDKRFFIYAIPADKDFDETKALAEIVEWVNELQLRIAVILIDRGIARNSDNINFFEKHRIPYLGLYPKYKNVKDIIDSIDGDFAWIDFDVKGVTTKLIVVKHKYTWVFATNLSFAKFFRYVQVYKKRWSIETGFRVQDEARIKTKSVSILVRYFLFLVSMLLYNIWKASDIKIAFKRMVIRFYEFVGRDGCGLGVL